MSKWGEIKNKASNPFSLKRYLFLTIAIFFVVLFSEICPQMDRLVQEVESGTKENYCYPITAGGNYSGIIDS